MPCFSILYNLVTIYERRKGALICIFCFRGNASLGNFYSLKFYNLKVFKMVFIMCVKNNLSLFLFFRLFSRLPDFINYYLC